MKIASKSSKNWSSNKSIVFFGREKENESKRRKWRARGSPHLAWARPGGTPRLNIVWRRGGSLWAAPGPSLPHLTSKNL